MDRSPGGHARSGHTRQPSPVDGELLGRLSTSSHVNAFSEGSAAGTAFDRPFITLLIFVQTLMLKNTRIILLRHPWRTLCMAFAVPVLLTTVFSHVKTLFVPPAVFGFGHVFPVRTLAQAFAADSAARRRKVVLIDNGHTGGDIQRVLNELARQIVVSNPRINVVRSHDESSLTTECRSTLRGVTSCFNAVVMMSSPNEGRGGIWNYSIRSDADMWSSPMRSMVDRSDKNEEVYLLPFQRAIDTIITMLEKPQLAHTLSQTQELAFTSMTQEERDIKVKRVFLGAITKFMGVAFLLSVIWISFHLPGLIATERETGMSQLLDAMMLTDRPWIPLAARIISHYVTFTAIYAPAWTVSSVVVHLGVFPKSSYAVLTASFVLGGLSITSFSMFLASFFGKAQLSGTVSILAVALLGILAQAISHPHTATVALLSLPFPPCAFVFLIILLSRFERLDRPMSLFDTCPDHGSRLPGSVLLTFLLSQTVAYPFLAALLEKRLYGTASEGRKVLTKDEDIYHANHSPIRLRNVTKIYPLKLFDVILSWFRKGQAPVVAVDNVDMTVRRGQIVALLGANGSGKSTTLESIAGLKKISGGHMTIDGRRGLGIAPQRNVFWDELTVAEHLAIFHRLKCPHLMLWQSDIDLTIDNVDLTRKQHALARTLSGGQKRKLQLGMMLIGGSGICCVDEVSSGVDPLSRRQLWDILLAERGKRTIIMTTQFLDEADLLADHICILSKGKMRAQGSAVELKNRFGGGWKVCIPINNVVSEFPEIPGVRQETFKDEVHYIAPTSELAYTAITQLQHLSDYRFSSPTLENVFLEVAEEIQGLVVITPENSAEPAPARASQDLRSPRLSTSSAFRGSQQGIQLLSGRRLHSSEQAIFLMRKRWKILKRNRILYAIAVILPVMAACLTSLYVKNTRLMGCSPSEQTSTSTAQDIFTQMNKNFNPQNLVFPIGPRGKAQRIHKLKESLPLLTTMEFAPLASVMFRNMRMLDSYGEFVEFTRTHSRNMTTGLWLGDRWTDPTIAWVSNMAFASPLSAQQFLNLLLTNTTIQTTWTPLERPFNPQIGRALNLVAYMGLALAFYPAFFALYPSNERRRYIRSLQYSNGVRPLPLWIAYVLFDFTLVLFSSALLTGFWALLSGFSLYLEYIFIVLCLYGLTSVMMGYLVSLFAKSQLATFAWAVTMQELAFLCYLISYVGIITFLEASKIDNAILVCHFVVSAFMPIASVVRALFLISNLFSVACDGAQLTKHPLGITKFGGPILTLAIQSCVLFALLLWIDSGKAASMLRNMYRRRGDMDDEDEDDDMDSEIKEEETRVFSDEGMADGLRLLNVTKSFGGITVVDNISFGISRGEIFALLGPNGAGKSTTISLIRGDIKMSRGSGDIFVENASIRKHLSAARASLGVCPQVDALDQLTVREHLEFYANIQGIPNISHNVNAILNGVGLCHFSDRMASQLSGGNKRKLSLGIALMGNPAVVLLDEPSSGLDAAAKRIMWRTLEKLAPGRSILLTSHSMEEVDALAARAGIMDRRMLALGTISELRNRFGSKLHVHLVSKTAPRTSSFEMENFRTCIHDLLPTAELESNTYHGQYRLSIDEDDLRASGGSGGSSARHCPTGRLVKILEENKDLLDIKYYSISPTTLDQVFINVVGDGGEDGLVEGRRHVGLARVIELARMVGGSLAKLFQVTRVTPVETNARPAVETNVRPAVEASVRPAVDTSVRPAVDTSVRPAVDTSVKPAVDTSVRTAEL